MPKFTPAFYIPGLGFLLLGLVSVAQECILFLPAIKDSSIHHRSDLWLTIMFTALLLISGFFISMGSNLLFRKFRNFMLVGSVIACLLIPFGSILGITVLAWTRKRWPINSTNS